MLYQHTCTCLFGLIYRSFWFSAHVYFSTSLARTETTTWLLVFPIFLGAPYFPGSVPILAVGGRSGKPEVEGVGRYVLPRMACLTS